MKLTDVVEDSNVVNISFHKPKPNQIGTNRPDKFKFKKGDKVSHAEYPGMYGNIVEPLFMHETNIDGYDNKGGYQEYINSHREDDAFSPWYNVEWVNADELEQERGTSIGLEPESSLTKIDNNTNNLVRLR